MKEILPVTCEVHVSVCTNERTDGRTACNDFGGMDFFRELKTRVKAAGLIRTHWVTRTGCLGFCQEIGTTVAIHRRGRPSRWFSEVTAADMPKIWEEITNK